MNITPENTQYISSDLMFLIPYHTRDVCSIRSALKDQYYNTEIDNGFNQNEGKWSDCNNLKLL